MTLEAGVIIYNYILTCLYLHYVSVPLIIITKKI